MSTLNTTRRRSPRIRTHEGGEGRTVPAELELALRAFTTNFHDKFYETSVEQLEQMYALVKKARPRFVEQLAIVARREFNMRSSPAALLAMYTLKHGQPDEYVIENVFYRGDEIGDYLGTVAALSNNGKVIPSAARFTRKVLQSQINERKALRYARTGRDWSLAKAIMISHARADAAPKQVAIFNFVRWWNELGSQKMAWASLDVSEREMLPLIAKAVEGTEDGSEVSWERQRSKGADWSDLIGNMGYMALLRNLRNFLEEIPATNTDVWENIVRRIGDSEEVHRSQQFPFRFLSAYNAISQGVSNKWTHRLRAALEDATDASVQNMPEFQGRSLFIADNSGSMDFGVSEKSQMTYLQIANLFAAAMYTRNTDSTVVQFASNAGVVKNLSPNDGVFGSLKKFPYAGKYGYGTNLRAAFGTVDIKDYDNIFIFSDMQIHDEVSRTLKGYKGTVYSVNLAAYTPQLDLRGTKFFEVGGWSDATLAVLGKLSNRNLTEWIMRYE